MDWACVPQVWIFLLGVVCPDSWWWYSDWYSEFFMDLIGFICMTCTFIVHCIILCFYVQVNKPAVKCTYLLTKLESKDWMQNLKSDFKRKLTCSWISNEAWLLELYVQPEIVFTCCTTQYASCICTADDQWTKMTLEQNLAFIRRIWKQYVS